MQPIFKLSFRRREEETILSIGSFEDLSKKLNWRDGWDGRSFILHPPIGSTVTRATSADVALFEANAAAEDAREARKASYR